MMKILFVYLLATLSVHCAIAANTYVFGINEQAQLGLGDKINRYVPSRLTLPLNRTAAVVSSGTNHTAIITSTGYLYTFGANRYGQLCLGDTAARWRPNLVSRLANKTLVGVVTSDRSTIAWTSTEVFVCGNNYHGQLGIGLTRYDLNSPAKINFNFGTIAGVSISPTHTLVWTASGNLYFFGSNFKGQAGGNIEKDNFYTPTQINFRFSNQSALFACAGNGYSLVYTGNNKLYGSGENGLGQLGLGVVSTPKFKFHLVSKLSSGNLLTNSNNENETLVGLSCQRHVAAWTSFGRLFTHGLNSQGQLGMGNTQNLYTPTLVQSVSNVVSASVGGHHTLIAAGQQVYGTGSNQYGQLGLGLNIAGPSVPTIIPGLYGSLVDMSAGFHYSVVSLVQ